MAIALAQVFNRIAIPMIVASLLLNNNIGHEQTAIYGKIQRESDKILSSVKGQENTARNGNLDNYDYIIIGAGSAGAVLAKRLTESGNDTVLVLEAGGDPNPVSDIPVAIGLVRKSDMMANYMSVPQSKACLGFNGGICGFQRGIVLGGCSSVNGLVYNRCNAKDYDSWTNFTNDSIWGYESVEKAFKAVESYHGFYENKTGVNHGTNGEMNIGRIEFLPGGDTFFEAVAEKGYPIGDLNSGVFPYGFSKIDYNIKNGLRWSTYHAFLAPILARKNLNIYRYSRATKIQLDSSKRAVGVTYSRHGVTGYAGANKEVIVAAGAIDSPKLLMLSGIGPRDHLSEHGIETILDLSSVGSHLQDHISTDLPHFSLNKTFGIQKYESAENINEYITNASGPLLGISFFNPFAPRIAMGYISSKIDNDKSWPDIQVFVYEQVIQPEGKTPEETVFAKVTLGKTNQTGTLRLASRNPDDHPLIDPQFLKNPMDLERIIDGIEEMVDFFLNSPTYKALGIKWSENDVRVPECSEFPFATREYWRCYASIRSSTNYHPTSTCRMGPNSTVAVVDSRLRVFGATDLRVIDASVMPFVPNGNTNFPSIMIGEMGARLILNLI